MGPKECISLWPPRLTILGFALVMTASCASTKMPSAVAPPSGFVREIDEPEGRGRLSRISPPNMNVYWRFAATRDGQTIVFSGRPADSKDPYQLYRIDLDSSSPVKLTSGEKTDAWDPCITEDGQYVVYRTNTTFWKIRIDGTGPKLRIPGSGLNRDYYPQISSKDRVAFVTYDPPTDKYEIWTTGIHGADLTQYREGNFPAWSPDGSRLAFAFEKDIWTMNLDGTELSQLTATPEIEEGLPSFSPDGEYIVYTSNESSEGTKGDNWNIWRMRLDGTEKTQITGLDSWDSWAVSTDQGICFLSGRGKGESNVQRIWLIRP